MLIRKKQIAKRADLQNLLEWGQIINNDLILGFQWGIMPEKGYKVGSFGKK